jgi:hypothetical protein
MWTATADSKLPRLGKAMCGPSHQYRSLATAMLRGNEAELTACRALDNSREFKLEP